MKLSLILATRNNATALDTMLGHLQSCHPPSNWEVIVVDNGSIDSTSEICNKYSDTLPLIYLYCKEPGKSRALNVATAQAKGELILYTDDDIIPDRAWLLNHIHVMQNHAEINVVGGRIKVDRMALPSWLTESYNLAGLLVTEHDLGNTEIIYPPGKYPYGPNMAIRTSVLSNIEKPWPENLGPGTRLPVGDEMVFVERVSNINERLYSPECVVEHRPTLPVNYFGNAVKRCFQGGYVAGYYAKALSSDNAINTIMKNVSSRIQSCSSVREFVCIVSRAAGYYSGRLFKHLF